MEIFAAVGGMTEFFSSIFPGISAVSVKFIMLFKLTEPRTRVRVQFNPSVQGQLKFQPTETVSSVLTVILDNK